MAKKDQFLVISNVEQDPNLSVSESVRESMAVCGTMSMAYRIALTLGRVSKPNVTYRKSLETIKRQGSTEIRQIGDDYDSPARAAIFKIKSY